MEYDNNRPFSSEGAAQERKRKHALGKGVIIGVAATLLVVILALSCVFMGLIRSGNLHIGIDGRIYVQDVGTSDNEGIGTKVEGKLNALDSLLGDGFYFDDVDDEDLQLYLDAERRYAIVTIIWLLSIIAILLLIVVVKI